MARANPRWADLILDSIEMLEGALPPGMALAALGLFLRAAVLDPSQSIESYRHSTHVNVKLYWVEARASSTCQS
jgi:hypothetical protein